MVKFTYLATIFSHALGALAAPSVDLAETKSLEERQGTGAAILVNTIASVLFHSGIFGNTNPTLCSYLMPYGATSWYQMQGQAPNGMYWQVCWGNGTDLMTWTEAEVNVANCLINLHYTQADTCISTAGSECDNGYVDGGGRLQNMRELLLGSGYQSGAQITADESAALQDAVWHFLDYPVQGTGENGPYFVLTTDGTYEATESNAAEMQANWIGEIAC